MLLLRLIYDVPYHVRKFHLYKEINFPKINTFIQHLNINFHLALETSEKSALNTLPAYDIFDHKITNLLEWELF